MIRSKNEVLALILIVATAFISGAYTTKMNIDSAEIAKTDIVIDKNVRTETQTTTVKQPDGTIKTVTNTVKDSSTKSKEVFSVETKISAPKLNVSLLAAHNFNVKTIVYGVSVTKTIIGPITTGVFGLNNGTLGVSLGLDF